MNRTMGTTIAKFLFYIVAVILLGWTATLTYSFVAAALPGMAWYVPLLALVVFDAGMIAWMYVFLQYAEGSGQRAVSILLCVFDFIGVSLMVIAEILLGGQTWAVPPESLGEMAVWGIGVWTIVNVAGVIAFHLLSPEARKLMALQSEKDAIMETALEMVTKQRVATGAAIASDISRGMYDQLKAELLGDANQDGIPDLLQSRNGVMSNDNQNSRSKQESANESRGNSQGPFRGL